MHRKITGELNSFALTKFSSLSQRFILQKSNRRKIKTVEKSKWNSTVKMHGDHKGSIGRLPIKIEKDR